MARAQALYHPGRARPRSRRRQRQRTVRSVFKWVFLLAAFGVIFTMFADYVLRSPRFSVWEVSVKGQERVSRESLIAAAGLDTNLNLLTLDTDKAEQRVAALPGIESCTIRREIPSRVYMSVVERVPAAVLLLHSHAYHIDRSGAVIRELEPLEPYSYPMITLPPDRTLPTPGAVLSSEEVQLALELVAEWHDSPLSEQWTFSEVVVASKEELLLYLEEVPFELRWGRSPIPAQMMRLEELVQAVSPLNCEAYLDLRFGPDLICK